MAAALMQAAHFYFPLANPKFAIHLSGELLQGGGPELQAQVDVQVVPGVAPFFP